MASVQKKKLNISHLSWAFGHQLLIKLLLQCLLCPPVLCELVGVSRHFRDSISHFFLKLPLLLGAFKPAFIKYEFSWHVYRTNRSVPGRKDGEKETKRFKYFLVLTPQIGKRRMKLWSVSFYNLVLLSSDRPYSDAAKCVILPRTCRLVHYNYPKDERCKFCLDF